MAIFIFRDGRIQGPYQEAEIRVALQANTFSLTDPAWQKGMQKWHSLTELIDGSATPPPYVAPDANANPTAASSRVEEIAWQGHPSFWNWSKYMVLGLVVISLGFYHLAISLIGILIIIGVFLVRNATTYTVTNHRVMTESGIFSKISRELRIQDIRTIDAQQNAVGFGNIVFSTAASEDSSIVFRLIREADQVRDLVRSLQN